MSYLEIYIIIALTFGLIMATGNAIYFMRNDDRMLVFNNKSNKSMLFTGVFTLLIVAIATPLSALFMPITILESIYKSFRGEEK